MTAKDGAANQRLFTIWVTSLDRVDHAVTDEEYAARTVQHRGEFRAVCGSKFLPAPMEAAPEPTCARCVASLRPATPLPRVRTRRRRWR